MQIQPDARQKKILDERTAWFYEAVTLSADMTTRTPGQGQVYLGVQKDKDGGWLQGGNNYTLRVPPNPPAKQFWALTLYDTEPRCFVDFSSCHSEEPAGDEESYPAGRPEKISPCGRNDRKG